MRICYVINSLDGGGGALPLPHILTVMRQAGHDPFVISLMERDGRARHLLDEAGFDYTVIGNDTRRWAKTAIRFDRIVRERRPDILWTSLTHATLTGELIGKLREIPVVSWLHNAWMKPANRFILRQTQALTRHWVADSDTVGAFGESELGIAPQNISTWPLFRADETALISKKWDQGPFRIGSLGRLHRNKGYDILIKAIASLPPCLHNKLSFHLAGEGPEREALEAQAHALGVCNLKFDGFQAQPHEFLSSLHAYTQPSHHEGFCIAAHEALQAGLPVIASAVGEMQYSIANAHGGFVVPYGDVAALAASIVALVEDPAQAHAMGFAGRRWVTSKYSARAFIQHGRQAMLAAGVV